MTVEQVAQIVHNANKTYCEQLGDNSQVRWEMAADWQKESAIKGVIFKIENPDANPEAQHESWCEEKIRTGWTYGETKDAEKKTHHCLVPYHQLSEEQRIKDHLFAGIVKSLIHFIN